MRSCGLFISLGSSFSFFVLREAVTCLAWAFLHVSVFVVLCLCRRLTWVNTLFDIPGFAVFVAGAQIRLKDFDALIFHAPYGKLVQKSLARLVLNDFLQHPTGEEYQSVAPFKDVKLEESIFDRGVEKAFIALSKDTYERKTKPSLLISNQVGNTYTSSLYSCLASYLGNTPIESIAGRRLGMFSYGSGSAATFFSLRVIDDVTKDSPLRALHDSLTDLKDRLAQRIKVSPTDFAAIMKHRQETHHLGEFLFRRLSWTISQSLYVNLRRLERLFQLY